MRQLRTRVWIAWGICAVLGVNTVILLILLFRQPGTTPLSALNSSILSPLLFAIPGALIISRHPRNVIGWLLLGPPLYMTAASWMSVYLEQFQAAPPPTTFINWFMIFFTNASWLALIFPLIVIPLLFPTGQPLTPRWRWTIYLAVGMVAFFFFWAIGTRVYEPEFASWKMPNPFGFLPPYANAVIMPVWTFLLAVLTVASLVSMVLRYRRASPIERQQMKWLLYACAIFGLIYLPSLYSVSIGAMAGRTIPYLVNMLLNLVIIAIPLSIAIAILRYHLFDIDVIIRLTLVYALVTGLLVLVYAGGIILLQGAFRILTGQTSSLAVVITTLTIAALFNPLRLRVQTLIDRRFFRQKYNAEQSLAEFALAARSGHDLDELTHMLIEITQKTLQPTQVGLQLTEGKKERN